MLSWIRETTAIPPDTEALPGEAASLPTVGLGATGIELVQTAVHNLMVEKDRVTLRTTSGALRHFDVVYVALGCTVQNSLARTLGCSCDEDGRLQVNLHRETSIPGLYAIGDVIRGLNQVVVAAAEGAIAATDIHNKLRDCSLWPRFSRKTA